MTKPLEGVRVVDLSQITSGPFGTMVLAEQGADVVKVESPTIGDLARWAPNSRNGMSSFVLNQNRGKRSIAVDLQHEAGRDVALDLMAGADVVVQNFRPGVIDHLGLGYDVVRARNAGVIYVSISGFGPDGPYADRPALDPVIQALAGVVYRQQSEAIPLPDLVRNIFVDKATSLTVAQSVCAALFRRTRTGEGDHVVVPMLDVGLYFFWPDGMMDMTFVGDGVAAGPRIVDLYQITHCADGQLVYYVATESQREGLYQALGHPEWSDDPRFGSTAALLDEGNRAALGLLLEAAFAALPLAEVLRPHARGERAGRPGARARAGVRRPAGAPQRDPAHVGPPGRGPPAPAPAPGALRVVADAGPRAGARARRAHRRDPGRDRPHRRRRGGAARRGRRRLTDADADGVRVHESCANSS